MEQYGLWREVYGQIPADGQYHFFVCGWLESSPRGHATWPNSTLFHAVSNNSFGPYVVKDTIGKGHNPESFRLTDGRYVIYVINGYYIADGVNGPWTYNKFEFMNRDRRIIDGITDDEFAAKLLGKTTDGKLLFGYARLPWVNYIEPILSARLPEIIPDENGFKLKVEVQNFGQVVSKKANIKIVYTKDEKEVEVTNGKIPGLEPYQKTIVDLTCGKLFDKGVEYNLVVIINPENKKPVKLHGKITPVK